MPVNSYYPDPPSDLTGGLPINLDSLRDGPPGSKPFYPYSTLIRYAIKGSPTGKLLLEDIYYAIESRFPYFRTAPSGWKNSVRHNLSLNPCFEKVARPLTDRGKGSYWTVNDNIDPRTGVHRIRKKRTHKSKRSSHSEGEHDVDYARDDGAAPSTSAGFETGGPAYDQQVMPPPPGPEDVSSANPYMYIDANGNVNWRSLWHNELTKLQHVTAEQDKVQASEEWYRDMFFRFKQVMSTPTGVYQMGVVAEMPPQVMQPPQELQEQEQPQ
ncbi:uncharacterized protein FOMMEDRAFT_88315 [Fomitiporia mediterranea MF3/22]|uniref:uncharacterized protein n=1 Tax=Fomitiporia mediterranea (strain MF3/22) TaxID=694068 RepID=UPI0004408A8B|nr:uncharacterized protein FOMMEDRAFT_88315 [Fomitiporia mediterranea MF3/22]EJD01412.1 hypothetical protein FOMMEDRAFT_88315 [Fomitiporia mediterranea MF3/22]